MGLLRPSIASLILVLGACGTSAPPAPGSKDAFSPTPQELALPGSPIDIQTTLDGKHVFVSLAGSVLNGPGPGGSAIVTTEGIALVEQGPHEARLVSILDEGRAVLGLALTPDGRYLIAAAHKVLAAEHSLDIFDVQKAVNGEPDALAARVFLPDGGSAAMVKLSPDGLNIYVSLESVITGKLMVLDFAKALATADGNAALIATFTVGSLPVGIDFSPDGAQLYLTVQQDFTLLDTLASCGGLPEGALLVVDTALARAGSNRAVVAHAPAGCQPVRVQVSADGKRVWVTVRQSGQVVAFDSARLRSNPSDAIISRTTVGEAPVGLQLFDGEQRLAVANSNRNANPRTGTLSILDTRSALAGADTAATLLEIPAGEFPRELAISPDGTRLYLSEYDSDLLAIFQVKPGQ